MKPQDFVKKLLNEDDKKRLSKYLGEYKKFSIYDRGSIKKILWKKKQTGQWFTIFLDEGVSASPEMTKKLCAWLLARKKFGLPYDREKVKNVICAEEKNLDNLRTGIYEAIKDTYCSRLDEECAERLASLAALEHRRIVCGRFSRAFYIDALLLANAKLIPARVIKPFLEKIRRMTKHSKVDFFPVESELQFLETLVTESEVPLARVKSGLNKLKNSIRVYEFNLIKKFEDSGKFELAERSIFDLMRQEIRRFEKKLSTAPSRPPAYMVFLQRIFPIDAIYMGLLNELMEPFFGEDPEIEALLADGGENIYVTADMNSWLKICDDWIEALPAYASYQIIPENGSYRFRAWVQRNILEEMYRANAANWAINIERVMMSENIDIARKILASLMHISFSSEQEIIEKTSAMRREITYLAAIIERSFENLICEVARLSEQEKLLRYESLSRILYENTSSSNLLKELLGKTFTKSTLKQHLEKVLKREHLSELAEKYNAYTYLPRRDIPSAHILTTLGPGESEFNVKNWLEESMLLFNIVKRYNLEEKVKNLVGIWKQNIVKVGQKVIREMHLESEVLKLTGSSEIKEEDVLKMVFAYREVGEEVSKIGVLLLKEGNDIGVTNWRAKEPDVVVKNLRSSNPALLEKIDKHAVCESDIESLCLARQQAIEEYGLVKTQEGFLKNYLNATYSNINAQKEIIIRENLISELSNPIFRYEANGPFKRYNLLYTPSRVDLGVKEVFSVRDIPKWVGGIDDFSANTGKKLYQLYNVAGPSVVSSTGIAEFLKVGENFFSRGGPYYLSLTAGINLDTLGIGDFEFFKNQWNARGDRKVLPSGETYGGFCVPKEFSLLYAVIIACVDKEASSQMMSSFGIPARLHERIKQDLRTVLSWQEKESLTVDWEAKAAEYLNKKYPEYFALTGGPICLSRLPQIAKTLEKTGILGNKDMDFKFTYWVNKKAQGLEEINRTGPFRKVRLIYQLIKDARKKNPDIQPDNCLIGTMAVNYKEGEMKDGKLIPVSDVRFSAGCRKLEIYSGLAERHLLSDIDPEGRVIIKQMFQNFISPADIRIVGSCTGTDIFNHVPGSGLEDIKNEVEKYLLDIGLDRNIITTNAVVYGGDISRWIGIRDIPREKQVEIYSRIGGKIHLLVVDKRGPYRSYGQAIQGIDFIDLGIPDPELLGLIENLPRMVYLMKKGRPESAMVFADGTSGARRPAFAFRYPSSRRKVKELFALEQKAVYGCLGTGRDVIEKWRKEMEEERELSFLFFNALRQGSKKNAQEVINRMRKSAVLERKFDTALEEESIAKTEGILSLNERYITDTFAALSNGLLLKDMDFGRWLILGGCYLINGRYDMSEIEKLRLEYHLLLNKMVGHDSHTSFDSVKVDYIVANLLKPIYHPSKEESYREISTGLAGSLKAVEEKSVVVARWDERKKELERMNLMKEKKRGYIDSEKDLGKISTLLSAVYKVAKNILGDGKDTVSAFQFGRFLRLSRYYFELLVKDSHFHSGLTSKCIENFFGSQQISDDDYLQLVGNVANAIETSRKNSEYENFICWGLELADIAFLIEKTYLIDTSEDLNMALAKFFDITVNSHIFDSLPYHYSKERSSGFEKFSRKEKFALAATGHRWLYTYVRYLMTKKSTMNLFSQDYHNIYLGDYDSNLCAIGVKGETSDEIFWFHYVRLRDAVVLNYEGFGYPEIITDINPEEISTDQRANVGIIYPYGNTTVPVALQQGPALAEKSGINLLLCAFPDADKGKQQILINEGLLYMKPEDIVNLREKHRHYGQHKNGMVFVTFTKPVALDGIFFHFTHPLRPYIDAFRIPIIQPLIWEAATHLKCELPAMLKGSGVRCPAQENWYMEDTLKYKDRSKHYIREMIKKLADRYDILIVKPEKESGGRKALIRQVKIKGQYIKENIQQLVDLVFDISLTDNVVIQQVIESRVRQLYSEEFLERLVERFARIGIPVLLEREPQTSLYSYFRQILVLGEKEYRISHHITVVSTRGIANVGQGGILFEYTDDIIHPKYRMDLRQQLTQAAYKSMEAQRQYLRDNWQFILRQYMKIHPEFAAKIKYDSIFTDVTGFPINDIPYEMGDYMPVFLVDEKDNLQYIFDYDKEEMQPLYQKNGQPTDIKIFDKNHREIKRVGKNNEPVSVPFFDGTNGKRQIFDCKGKEIPSLVIYKIEPNPGAGLWRPHNDQLPPERKGEGVFIIFDALGQRAKQAKKIRNYQNRHSDL